MSAFFEGWKAECDFEPFPTQNVLKTAKNG